MLPTRMVTIGDAAQREDWFVPADERRSRCARRAPEQGSGVLVGRVRTRATHAPLGHAAVELAWQQDSLARTRLLTSDADGVFVACWLPLQTPLAARVRSAGGPGPRIAIAPIPATGYAATELITGGVAAEAAAAQDSATVPIRLGALEVRAVSPAPAARAERGAAVGILTRRELEPLTRRARHIGDLVRDLPGIRVRELRPARAGGLVTGICIESGRGTARLGAGGCESVLVIVDGVPFAASGGEDLAAATLLSLPTGAIESIEYVPPAEAGARFGTGALNGALVIYTRGNGPYAPGAARR